MLCSCQNHTAIYNDKIRTGDYGKESSESHEVIKCNDCGLVRLKNNPLSIGYYQSSEYRDSYNSTSVADDYIDMHDNEQSPRVDKIGVSEFRNKKVLDFGCGGGAFLDLIKNVADITYGIEPFEGYHESLKNRGHYVFSNEVDAIKELKNSVDVIVSFGVIEHVEEPIEYLKSAFSLLRQGGKMYIETDNLDDVLMKFEIDEFDRFFYRTAHLWYFNAETLTLACKKSGFENIKLSFRHNYDLSNTLMWLKDRKPTGKGKIPFIDSRLNAAWISAVEELGFADLICLELIK